MSDEVSSLEVKPKLSVVIPTFNNLAVLRECLASWQRHATGQSVELVVIEDGCRDGTADYLRELCATPWGRRHARWFHEDNAHELRCTNRGFAEARGQALLAWQDDMFLQHGWLPRELIALFEQRPEIGLVSLGRGLLCHPLDEPITAWEHLIDWRRLESTIGHGAGNWFRLQEVDAVVRPWVVRRACLDRVNALDEVFRPTEWDEADLCFRIRQAGWKIATHGYERLGAYRHLGSSTIGRTMSEQYMQRVLRNGLIFHERWDAAIRAERGRPLKSWLRPFGAAAWAHTVGQMARAVSRRLRPAKSPA